MTHKGGPPTKKWMFLHSVKVYVADFNKKYLLQKMKRFTQIARFEYVKDNLIMEALKAVLFGTHGPNVVGWGRLVPNFYNSLLFI